MRRLETSAMAAASILCALLLLNTAYARADEPAPQPFDISPQSLATALSAFARQSQQEILYSPDVVAQKLSSGVHGTLRPLAALKILLKDSGLTVTTTPKGAILVGTPPATGEGSQSASSKESITSDAVSTQGEKPERPFGDRIRLAQATQDASAQIAPTQSGEAARGEALEEIVVTASKRADETLKEVPGALTALSGKTLNNLGVVDFNDYLPYVPGLSSNPSGTVGNPGSYTVILRGLNTGSSQQTGTVGYYLDDTPLTASASNSTAGAYQPDPDLGDVERIEVLKGPQATLYGASTLGGLIKIVSKKPDLTTFSGDASVGGVTVNGGGRGYTVRAAINVPLVQDVLAMRLSAFDRQDPGFTNNVLTGQNNINLDHAHGARLSLRYEPTGKLTFDLTGLIQQLYSDGNTLEFLDPKTLQPIYGHGNYSTLGNTTTSSQLTLFSLSANYDTGWGTLTNSLGFARNFLNFEHFPFTTAFGPLVLPRLHLTSPPIAFEGINTIPENQKTTDELRFTSIRMNNFLWQVGLFYTYENVAEPHDLLAVSYPSPVALPSPPNPLLNAQQSGTYREYAGFGDLTYYFTDALDATAGIRYSHNEQTATDSQSGLLTPPGNVSQSFNASDKSYLFDLRYRATQRLSTYLRAASAYRPGGPETVIAPGIPTSFGPDTDWDYEVGAKGLWLDNTLNANLAVYYIDWRNIHIATLYGGAVSITGNGGNAKSQGVEFDGSYEPVRGLAFGANATYDEAVMTSANPANTAGARVGDPLPFTPRWAGSLTGDYSFPLAPGVKGGVGASWAYTGFRYSSFSADPLNPREVIPSYALFGVRGHVDWNRTSLALNVNNVANKQTFTNVDFRKAVPGEVVPGFGYPLQPLTVRLTLSVNF